MPFPGHKCLLKYVSRAFGTTADTVLVSGTTYAAKQTIGGVSYNFVFDPAQTVSVNDGGSPFSGTFTVNHLAGTVTLSAPPSGIVTLPSLSYLAVNNAAEVREFSINLARDELDDTVFGDDDKSTLLGLKAATGSVGGLALTSDLYIAAPNDASIDLVHNDERLFVIDVLFNTTTRRGFRAICKIPTLDTSGARDGLIESSFGWISTDIANSQSADGRVNFTFLTHA